MKVSNFLHIPNPLVYLVPTPRSTYHNLLFYKGKAFEDSNLISVYEHMRSSTCLKFCIKTGIFNM